MMSHGLGRVGDRNVEWGEEKRKEGEAMESHDARRESSCRDETANANEVGGETEGGVAVRSDEEAECKRPKEAQAGLGQRRRERCQRKRKDRSPERTLPEGLMVNYVGLLPPATAGPRGGWRRQ